MCGNLKITVHNIRSVWFDFINRFCCSDPLMPVTMDATVYISETVRDRANRKSYGFRLQQKSMTLNEGATVGYCQLLSWLFVKLYMVSRYLVALQKSTSFSSHCVWPGPYLRGGVTGSTPPRNVRKNFFAALNLQRLNCNFASMAPCSACLLGLHFFNYHHSLMCNTMILTF